jgi:hypothetical protein
MPARSRISLVSALAAASVAAGTLVLAVPVWLTPTVESATVIPAGGPGDHGGHTGHSAQVGHPASGVVDDR